MSSSASQRLAQRLKKLNPADDEWESEIFSTQAAEQLEVIEHLILQPESIDQETLLALVDERFSCAPLRPSELLLDHESENLSVHHASPVVDGKSWRGRAGLVRALEELGEPIRGSEDVHIKWKLYRVEPDGETVHTDLYYQTYGPGAVHQFANWSCLWSPARGDALPKLLSIETNSYSETSRPAQKRRLFHDATQAVLGETPSYEGEVLPGLNHWRGLLDRTLGVTIDGHQGLALGDLDGDQLEDLYVCRGGGLPNRLYLRLSDGRCREASKEAGLDVLDLSRSALILDFDADGDQDLVLAGNSLTVFANEGDMRFRVAGRYPAISNAMSLCAADFDGDGDLDLYACRYTSPETGSPQPYHDANNGPANVLLRNDGRLRFTDVTVKQGMDTGNRRFSYAASWEDYDNDGDQDLYVANDYGRNNLYRNDGGSFVDVAAEVGVQDISAGMGVTWADYDRNGAMDVYVSNMFSSAGNRVTFQRNFQEGVDESARVDFQRHARGNSLFENSGDGSFQDVSQARAVTMGRWAWGSLFADLNSDGFEDLYVANGFLTNEISTDL